MPLWYTHVCQETRTYGAELRIAMVVVDVDEVMMSMQGVAATWC